MMFHWHSHSFLIAPLLRSSLPTQETTDAVASNHNSAAFQPLSDCIEAAAEIHIVLYCSCRDILTNGPVGGIENPSPRRRREREMFEDLEQTPTTLPAYYTILVGHVLCGCGGIHQEIPSLASSFMPPAASYELRHPNLNESYFWVEHFSQTRECPVTQVLNQSGSLHRDQCFQLNSWKLGGSRSCLGSIFRAFFCHKYSEVVAGSF